MKSAKLLFRTTLIAGVFFTAGAHAASWQDSLSSAASQLSSQSGSQGKRRPVDVLADQPAERRQSVPDRQQHEQCRRDYVLLCQTKTGLGHQHGKTSKIRFWINSASARRKNRKRDTSYLEGLQGLLSNNSGQQLNLNTLGSSPLAEKVKTKACDLVLKQGVNFLS